MKHPTSYSRILSLKNLFSFLTATLLLSPNAFAAEVTLAWDPSPDPGVAAYRLHYGTASGIYTGSTNAGSTTTLTVRGLLDGATYYFVATAVGTNQLESDFSNEISYSVPAANTAPTITVIAGQSINEDGVAGPISFTVGDGESAAGALTLSAASSNPGLVPVGNIVFGGNGANRTVTLTPVANNSGIAQITVSVSDGQLSATRQFTLTVNSVNDVPTVTAIPNQTIDEDGATGALNFTVGDVETAAGSLILSAASSNPGLVPEANITFGGSGASRSVTVRPAANQNGTAQITISVSDGNDAVTSAFTLTVNAVNDAPTIAAIGNQVINEDGVAGPISFTVGDVESAAGALTLSAASSNPSLVPVGNVVFGGSGVNRAVTVTPAANQFGTAQITMTVSDGDLTAARTFTLTVNSVNDAPTLASISDVNIAQNTGQQTINLSGIGSGATNENQTLTISASSSKPGVVPDPVVTYSSPASTGSLRFTPVAGQNGSVVVTVTVSDNGGVANGGISSAQRTFTVNVTPPENTAPTITVIGNQSITEDGVAGPINFTVGDAETAAGSLVVSASSGNPTLVPNSNIVFGGSGASRTVTLTPVANQFGTSQVTVSVSDGEFSASRQFTLTVNSVNDVPTVTAIPNQTIDEDGATGALSFTVGDVETAAGSLVVSALSGNPTLVPNSNITFGGSGASRTVTVTPAANQSGTAQITISVSDANDAVTSAFTLTVNAVNDAPTIAAIGNQVIDEDGVAGPISFTVGDVESAAGALTLSAASSNPSLVPVGNIVFGGSGVNRAVTVTPAANQFGTAQITVTVSDGDLTSDRAFTLTVNSVEDAPLPPSNLRLAQAPVQ